MWRWKWSFLAVAAWALALEFRHTVLAVNYPMCTEEFTIECCLCEENANCTVECPDKLYKIYHDGSSCSNIREPDGTTKTPDPTTNGTSESPGTRNFTICVKCAGQEYYDNETLRCKPCSTACIGCNSSSEDCVICKYKYNDTCKSNCPAHTIPGNVTKENTTICVDYEVPDSTDNKTYIYIGAGAGGAVLILVVVVACCCCRRRRSGSIHRTGNTERSAMSQIIEISFQNREAPDTPERPPPSVSGQKMGNTLRPPNYTNISSPGEKFATHIEQQTDTVLRYTKDPTVKKEVEPRPQTEEIYENTAMVNLQGKIDLSKESAENIHKLIDNEEIKRLGEAPRPPGVQAPSKKNMGKANIIKRLSKKMTKKQVPKEIKVPAATALESGEDYIDMSGQEEAQLEDYENINLTQQQQQPEPTELEDYENIQQMKKTEDPSAGRRENSSKAGLTVEKQSGKVKQDAEADEAGLEDYENVPKKLEEDGMEDYENTQFGVEENPYMNTHFSKKK